MPPHVITFRRLEQMRLASQRYREAHPDRQRLAEQRYSKAHPDRVLEKNRAYRAANKEKVQAQRKARYEAHKGESVNRTRIWREAHREYARSYQRAYGKAFPEVIRAASARRRALRSGAQATLTLAQWRAIVLAYKGRCAYCGVKSETLTQDHVIPLSKGGQHVAENVVPACMPCNAHKHAGPPPLIPSLRLLL